LRGAGPGDAGIVWFSAHRPVPGLASHDLDRASPHRERSATLTADRRVALFFLRGAGPGDAGIVWFSAHRPVPGRARPRSSFPAQESAKRSTLTADRRVALFFLRGAGPGDAGIVWFSAHGPSLASPRTTSIELPRTIEREALADRRVALFFLRGAGPGDAGIVWFSAHRQVPGRARPRSSFPAQKRSAALYADRAGQWRLTTTRRVFLVRSEASRTGPATALLGQQTTVFVLRHD
jgi:hypothetical protein